MVDTAAGHFGFCPLDFTDVKSCPMGRACIDSHSCTSGCGKMGDSGVETATWYVISTNTYTHAYIPYIHTRI